MTILPLTRVIYQFFETQPSEVTLRISSSINSFHGRNPISSLVLLRSVPPWQFFPVRTCQLMLFGGLQKPPLKP